MPLTSEPVELTVEAAETGCRLDAFLAARFPDYSRVHLRRVIMAGGVKIDGRGGKPAYRLKPEQRVSIRLPELPRQSPRPENIPLEILFEDENVVVVNKPPGMVVHPARGHWSGTLVGALQFRFGPTLSAAGGLNRPGIVHRLDRDTSGAILVARNDVAHAKLAKQFAARSIEKEYFALVSGSPPCDRDIIDCPIGFHPHVREKMAIRHDGGQTRPAQTFYETLERFQGFSAVSAQPKTGRTHQIRVHLNHLGCRGAVRSSIWRAQSNHPWRNPPRSRRRVGPAGSPGPARPAFAIFASYERRADRSRGAAACRHCGSARRAAQIPRLEVIGHLISRQELCVTCPEFARRDIRRTQRLNT